MAITVNIDSQVLPFADLAAFPATGTVKTIYIAEDTDFSYYWDGTDYIQLSGGGGNQTLQDVTDEGNTTTNNIEFNGNVGLIFDNASKVTKGTTDANTGGSKGVALKCSIDYELKWEAGSLYVMEQDGFTIREVAYKRYLTPTVNDDDTKGFVEDSRWILDNGDVYLCTDSTTGAAVWNLENYDSQNLQSVTDFGNTTTNSISVENAGVYTTLDYEGVISTLDSNTSTFAQLNSNGFLTICTNGTAQSFLQSSNTDDNITLEFPNKVTGSYTIATVDDIPSTSGFVPYEGATEDVDLGNNDLYTNKIFVLDEINENYGSIHYADGDLHIEDADGHKLLVIEDGFMQLHLSDTIQSNLFTTNLTETRNHYLPDNSGTIALALDRLHAFSAPYDYNGHAAQGSSQSAAVWTITRITIASNGTTTKGTATGSWDNRASLTYV